LPEQRSWIEVRRVWGDCTLTIDHVRPGHEASFEECLVSHDGRDAVIVFPTCLDARVEPDGEAELGRDPLGLRTCRLSQGQRLALTSPREGGPAADCIVSWTAAPEPSARARASADAWGPSILVAWSLVLHVGLLDLLHAVAEPPLERFEITRDQLWDMHSYLQASVDREPVDLERSYLEPDQAHRQLQTARYGGAWHEVYFDHPDRESFEGEATWRWVWPGQTDEVYEVLWSAVLRDEPRATVVAHGTHLLASNETVAELLATRPIRKERWGFGNSSGHSRIRPRDPMLAAVVPRPTTTLYLEPGVVDSLTRTRLGRIRNCYRMGLEDNPNLQGNVAVRFVVGADGRVSAIANAGSDLPDPFVVWCTTRQFNALRFPAPRDRSGVAIVRFSFSPEPGQ
jgi:hypothetical protein